MSGDFPTVSVWAFNGTQWGLAGDLPTYTALDVDVRHNDAGQWSMTIPNNSKAAAIAPGRFLTFDWRGIRFFTGIINQIEVTTDDTGAVLLNLSGLDALSYLGEAIVWRDPTVAWTAQPGLGSVPFSVLQPVETLVLNVIRANMVTRRGNPLTVPSSAGRGSLGGYRPNFQNLQALVTDRCNLGGIGIRVGLVNVTGNLALSNLTVSIYAPQDRSIRVVFDQQLGTLTTWSQTSIAPSTTRALVQGDSATFVAVPSAGAATALETTWRGRRETFVKGNSTTDTSDLSDSGQSVVNAGTQTLTVSVQAAETGGLKAFRDYRAGDIAKANLLTGLSLTDTITSIRVTVDGEAPVVTTTFGDPDKANPDLRMAQIIRALRRDVQQLKRST